MISKLLFGTHSSSWGQVEKLVPHLLVQLTLSGGQVVLADASLPRAVRGAGGMALGVERAGFQHAALVEFDHHACETLRRHRPEWPVMEMDVRDVAFTKYRRIDPSDRGAPCQPFSTAGKQRLGEDPRNMFPEVLSAIHRSRPRALLLENVPGMLMGEAREYFDEVVTHIDKLGYETSWNLGNCAGYGVGAGLRRGLPP